MKTPYKLLVLICFTSFVLISCDKDDHVSVPDVTERLTGKKWQRISIISTDSTGKQTDIFTSLSEFQKDDYLIYNADSTYELNDNIILRSDTVTRIADAGSWELIENGSKIEMYSNVFLTRYEPLRIIELTASKLHVEAEFPSDKSRIKTIYQRME